MYKLPVFQSDYTDRSQIHKGEQFLCQQWSQEGHCQPFLLGLDGRHRTVGHGVAFEQ